MRTRGRQPTRFTRLVGLGLAVAGFVVLLGAAPATTVGPRAIADLAESGGGASAGGGTGGSLLSTLGPLLLIGLAIAVVVLVIAAFVLFRTRHAVATPAASTEGWWTCASCGAGNMDGAARCHNCGTWRSTTSRSTTSASP